MVRVGLHDIHDCLAMLQHRLFALKENDTS